MRRKAIAGTIAAIVYFGLAYYFKVSYVEDVPNRDDVAKIMRLLPTGTPGTFLAHMWLPTDATKATIYENGTSIGPANTIYADPTRTWIFAGRQWKLVEFNSKGEEARRWIVFSR